MQNRELSIRFECEGSLLPGIVHRAEANSGCGVLIVVGGPQYRAGSHRQFLLLARDLAQSGIPAMRFDYRGMGDAEGEFAGFEHIEHDIAAAIDAFFKHCPSLREIVLWGLCDAASAILFYAHKDPRIKGIVLLNPWVRTDAGMAQTYLKHYYGARFTDPLFWRRLIRGEVNLLRSAGSVVHTLRRALRKGKKLSNSTQASDLLPDRMAAGLQHYQGRTLLIMSGNDLTAREFDDAAERSALWPHLLASDRLTRRNLPDADHTFSRRAWRTEVARWTVDWLATIVTPSR